MSESHQSETLGQLAAALAKAQGAIKNAARETLNANPHINKKYADLASVWDACRAPLAENGLAVVQRVTTEGDEVTVTTMLLHASGEFVSDSASARVAPIGAQQWVQALGLTVTYLRRYQLSALVGVAAANEDTDGEGASAEPAEPRSERPARSNGAAPATFPNFGKAKGEAIAGASPETLESYLGAARRTLADPEKARWHAKESALIGAYEAELARQRGSAQAPEAPKKQLVVEVRPGETEEQAKARAIYETAVELIGQAGSIARVDTIIRSATGKISPEHSVALEAIGWDRKKSLQTPTQDPGANG